MLSTVSYCPFLLFSSPRSRDATPLPPLSAPWLWFHALAKSEPRMLAVVNQPSSLMPRLLPLRTRRTRRARNLLLPSPCLQNTSPQMQPMNRQPHPCECPVPSPPSLPLPLISCPSCSLTPPRITPKSISVVSLPAPRFHVGPAVTLTSLCFVLPVFSTMQQRKEMRRRLLQPLLPTRQQLRAQR